jgi:hypothetical protein
VTSPPVTYDLAVRVKNFLNHRICGEDDMAHEGPVAGCKIGIAGVQPESVPTKQKGTTFSVNLSTGSQKGYWDPSSNTLGLHGSFILVADYGCLCIAPDVVCIRRVNEDGLINAFDHSVSAEGKWQSSLTPETKNANS